MNNNNNKQTNKQTNRVELIALLVFCASCSDGAHEAHNPARTTRSYQERVVGAVKPVAPVIVEEWEGHFGTPNTEQMASAPWSKTEEGPVRQSPPPDGTVANALDGKLRLLRYDLDGLEAVASKLVPLGIAEPTPPDRIAAEPSSSVQGWSANYAQGNGVDNRINLSSATGWQLKTIGRLWASGGCTATFFGRRLLITAAHCIINPAGNYVPGTFIPAVNGASAPFGQHSVIGAWWGGNYISKCTGGAPGYWADCVKEDWALLLLADSFPMGHPGWLGFAWLSQGDIQGWPKFSNGYPGCYENNSPANCQPERLYGQLFGCSFGEFRYPFGDGFYSSFTHGCDNGPGHSGSGMYTTGLGSFHIFGVASVQQCTTCTVAEQPNSSVRLNPNIEKRIDGYIFNLMANLRATYP